MKTVKTILLLAVLAPMCVSSLSGQNMGVNNLNPDPSALLDLTSTEKGFLMPRMTTAQRNSIANPAQSLLIFNTTNQCIEIYIGTGWNSVSCPACPLPETPVEGTHTTAQTQIDWNWTAVSGATGYKWNTVNDYGSATDMGTATTMSENGLTCNTSYTRYIWAYNDCGNSPSFVLTASTSACK